MPLPGPAARWRLAGVLVLLAAASPLLWTYLGDYPRERWQADLDVYREGARALVHGWPLYDVRTDAPNFLPFTYPPFAALGALPLTAVPFDVAGWLWTLLQLGLLFVTVGLAFRPFLARFGDRAGLVQGALAAGAVWFLPVADGIRYGQVNAVVVALCLADVARRERRDGRALRIPRGVLTGVAVAVKLTPGVLWLHWAAARRGKVLAASIAGVAVATVGTVLLLPQESAVYWGSVVFDSTRLGPNAGTANQSLRGALLRIGPSGTAGSVLWLVLVVAVLALGLRVSTRMERLGDQVAVVAAAGMTAFLISPVSWVHHLHWGVVAVGALLGDGRRRARVAAAGAVAVALWCRLPWWGDSLLASGAPDVLGRLLQNSYPLVALGVLAGLWALSRSREPAGDAYAEPRDDRQPTPPVRLPGS